MEKFHKLLIHEMNRAKQFYLSLIAGVFGIELIVVMWQTWIYIQQSRDPEVYANMPSIHFGYIFSQNIGLAMIIGAAIAAMKLYAFYTWIQEWRLQGNFIYRLLLLPGKRVTIAYAKLTSIMLMIFGLLSMQVIFVQLINFCLQQIFSAQRPSMLAELSYFSLTGSGLDTLLLPRNFGWFLLVYTLGFGCLVWIANVLIGFFSLRSQGVMKAIGKLSVYSMLSIVFVGIFIVMLMNIIWIGNEVNWALGIFVVLWTGGHLSIMHYLMKRAISI